MRLNLFHLTPSENVRQIAKEGLKADEEGNIFAFTDMLVANPIARDQVFTERYTVFKINRKGITGDIEPDNVGEFTRPYHKIIKQNRIEPKFLKVVSEEDTLLWKPTLWDYLINERLHGWTIQQTRSYFDIIKWRAEHHQKGDLPEEQIDRTYRAAMEELNFKFLDNEDEFLSSCG